MRTRAALATTALALCVASPALAQNVVCLPGTSICGEIGPDGKIVVKPPPATVQGPTLQGNGQTSTQTGPVVVSGPSYQEQLATWRLQWDAYIKWRADLRAQIDLDVSLKLHAEARAADLAVPDPWASRPLIIPTDSMGGGRYGAGEGSRYFPRFSLGLLALCFGHWTGPGAPVYGGWCPSIRYRFGALAIGFDPSLMSVAEAGRSSMLFGLRPDVTYAVVAGAGQHFGSELFVRGGLDAYLPFDSDFATPSAYLGAHVGIGAQATADLWAFGVDWRATLRGGVNPGADQTSRDMATLRVGTEARLYVAVEF